MLRIALSADTFLLAFRTMPVEVTARSAFTLFYEIRVVLASKTGISSLTGFALFVEAAAGRTFVVLQENFITGAFGAGVSIIT